MQFKHPELLYALFLLLIPVFIHLFQLRRFQKVAFTNVAFLKKVTIQTRKSSKLKKWITLLLRLLALAAIIFAFAQPFTASKTALNTKKETVVYIDNSFSMQAKGANGPLLERAKQQLYDEIGGNSTISWFTNTRQQKNISLTAFKADVLNISYTSKQLTPQEVILKSKQLFSKDESSDKRLVWISDFQVNSTLPNISNDFSVEAVQLKPQAIDNVSIDSVYIAAKNAQQLQLNVSLSARGDVPASIPVSVFNNELLLAKSAIDFSEKKQNKVTFNLDATELIKGKIAINDANVSYDNTLFFSINAPKKIKVLAVSDQNQTYLQRIFSGEEFEYTTQTTSRPDYNIFGTQNFIILNELSSIPSSLTTALEDFVNKGGSIFLIPSETARNDEYNFLLNKLRLGSYGEVVSQEKKITQIVFSHPLYKNVFEREVVNFQYPKVNSYYTISSNAAAALKFEDGSPFILQQGTIYASTAAINTTNSNFKNSPLIVPTLLNMAQQSLPITQLYYNTNKQNTYAIPISLLQDEIVTLKDSVSSFVPLQQARANKVVITTEEEPQTAGIYSIMNKNTVVEDVSYNYARTESVLKYHDASEWQEVRTYDSIEDLFTTLTEENTINSFWKWFVIFALLFLILEMIVLKFYKN